MKYMYLQFKLRIIIVFSMVLSVVLHGLRAGWWTRDTEEVDSKQKGASSLASVHAQSAKHNYSSHNTGEAFHS